MSAFMHHAGACRRACLATLALFLMLAPVARAADEPGAPLVFAAASLTEALQEIAQRHAAHGAPAPRLSFASSAVLARQIEAGAPAGVFVSADQEWMDYLQDRNLIRRETRHDLVANRLVLVAPADSAFALRIAPGFDLAGSLAGGRLAVGDPDSVPAGRYARGALMSLGVWKAVVDRLARAENVRAALSWVARKETPLGIVYATDARAEPGVRVIDVFPADTHPPIRYPVAATRASGPADDAFIAFLAGDEAREVLLRHGFVLIGKPAAP